MYQTENGKEWDTDLWQRLVDKRIAFSKASAESKLKLVRAGALPSFDYHYDWAMLCISYCFAIGSHLPSKLKQASDMHSGNALSFTTCFQDKHKLWLAYISDALFEYKQAPCTQDDLIKYIQDLWHTGALALEKRWNECREFHPDSLLKAKQSFLSELANLAKKNSGSHQYSSESVDYKVESDEQTMIDEVKLDQALRNMNLPIKHLKWKQKGVREDIYQLALNKYVDLAKHHDALCSNLGVSNESLRIKRCTDGHANSYDIHVQRPKNDWRKLGKDEFQAALRDYSGRYILPVCLGLNELGEPYFADLATAPHIMIGGTTGSGKTVFVRSMLHSLFQLNETTGKLQVAIADGKGGADFKEFTKYSNLYKHCIVKPQGIDINSILEMLNEQLDEMNARKELNDQHGVSKLSELPEHIRPPYHVVVIDEIGTLLEYDNGELEDVLIQLTAQGRSLGIYVILSTQRPDSNSFEGSLRTNTPARIALKVSKGTESKIILDEYGAEKLSGHGDHLVNKWQDVPDMLFLHGFDI